MGGNYSVAIDLGGTIIKIGLILDSEIVRFTTISSDSVRGLSHMLPKMEHAIDSLLSEEGISSTDLVSIGLAFPGMVNPVECRVISTNDKYDDACDIDLCHWADSRWGVPFVLENDARLAVIGEWLYGAAKGTGNVVMMTIGTGIGTGVILDSKPLVGHHHQAGSLGGHMVVDYRGRRCSCGNIGCVEAMASSFFLSDIIRSNERVSPDFKIAASDMDFKQLFGLMRQGDENAIIICEECMNVWAAAIVSYIHAYDPEVVVLGGGIMRSADIILPYINKWVEDRAWTPIDRVHIVLSELGDNAALLGLNYYLTSVKRRRNEKVFKL